MGALGDPFGGLSEAELKAALGEAVEEVKAKAKEDTSALKEEIKKEVGKALSTAFEQTKLKEALKTMKITISISFEGE